LAYIAMIIAVCLAAVMWMAIVVFVCILLASTVIDLLPVLRLSRGFSQSGGMAGRERRKLGDRASGANHQ